MSARAVTAVSVVINTFNRADSLHRTLLSLEQLDHPLFEVVVVNGPSTDHTDAVLAAFAGRIKVGACPERNLSHSRNLGIALAAGEIVAFIDDDAYPDPAWLDHLLAGYDWEEVAGVGGPAYDHTGAAFQARYSVANRFGVAHTKLEINPTGYLGSPYSEEFNYLIGTNSSFRRDRLVDIGGFDEEFEYYLDETDVCRRLADRGLLIRSIDTGFVYHKFLPSEIRTPTRTLRERYSVLKNTCYFALKHGLPYSSFARVCAELDGFIAAQRADVRWNHEHGYLSDDDVARFERDLSRAFDDALRIHAEGRDRTRPPEFYSNPPQFLPFTTLRPAAEKLHVCFLSQEWPPMPLNGIARFVHELATGLAADGHVVRVLTRGEDHDRVDLEERVWVHRVVVRPHQAPVDVAVPQHIWDYSASLLDELRRVEAMRHVDVVQAPNWDSEGIAMLLAGGFPMVVWLHTPLKIVRAVDPGMAEHHPVREQLEMLERIGYEKADRLLACGPTVVQEIAERYDVQIEPERVGFVPHGIADVPPGVVPETTPGAVDLLFVGRLEPRKGIDTLLDCVPALCEQFPDLHVTIVGRDVPLDESGATFRERFQSSPQAARFAERVRFAGPVDDDELLRLYAGCDVFVAPSRFESFGLILVEAMRFAKPVVACRVGGMADVVEDGRNGLLVPPGDSAALQEALGRLIGSEELREQFGRRSRELFLERYTLRHMVDGMVREYALVAGRRHAPQSRHAPPEPSAVTRPTPPRIPPATPAVDAARHASLDVLDRIVCPICREGPSFDAAARTVDGRIKTGEVRCAVHGTVASVRNFKADFRLDEPALTPPPERRLDALLPPLAERRVTPESPDLVRRGTWSPVDRGWILCEGRLVDALELTAWCTDAVVRVLSHPYSGVVDVFCDGDLVATVDLYQAGGSTIVAIPAAEDLPFGPHTVLVKPRGAKHPDSGGAQVVFEEIVLFAPAGTDGFAAAAPINRGNPYSEVIERYLAAVPPQELILEVGGGDRRRCNPHHVNFEYLKFELADGYADIHALPFADDTFSLVFSQAVFEHVANPFHAAEELIRVCRPGGLLLTEVAFMQPLHAVPYHFFNMTPWGVEELFKSCETVELDWFGELSFTVEWLMQSVNLPGKVPPDRLQRIVDELKDLDSLVTHADLKPSASGVYLVVRKPLG